MVKKQTSKGAVMAVIFLVIVVIGAVILWLYKPWTFGERQQELLSRRFGVVDFHEDR